MPTESQESRRNAWLRYLAPRAAIVWAIALVSAGTTAATGSSAQAATVVGVLVGVIGTVALVAQSADAG